MTEPHLLVCPNCKLRQDEGNLGSNKTEAIHLGTITSDGYFAMRRKFGQVTVIMADAYSVICSCGYYVRIKDGRIQEDSLHTLSLND